MRLQSLGFSKAGALASRRRCLSLVRRFIVTIPGILLLAALRTRADDVYVGFENSNDVVEEFNSSGASGINVDIGSVPGTTSSTSVPNGMAFDASGNLYVANFSSNSITEFTSTGPKVFATGLDMPAGIAFDKYGDLYVANNGNGTIMEINPAGVSKVYAAGLSNANGLAFDASGNLYVAANDSIKVVSPSGTISTFASPDGGYDNLNNPIGLAFDSSGNLYVANQNINTIEKFSPSGVGTVFASNGSDPGNPANPDGLHNPAGIAFDSSGDLFVANYGHTQVDGEPYEGYGISYIDEFSATGSLIDAFTNNPAVTVDGFNLRDGAYIAITTDAGTPLLQAVPEPSAAGLMVPGMATLLGFARLKRRRD
jgi:secreted PhoX family phosphatase